MKAKRSSSQHGVSDAGYLIGGLGRRSFVRHLAFAGAAMLPISAVFAERDERRDIPDILKVPAGNVLLLRAYGRGVQKYACPVSADSKAVPHAILLAGEGDEEDVVGIHFGGPTWEALDGSSVVGDAPSAKHFTAPEPDCLDWLLIPAKSTTGNGLFSRVTYIQRLHTDGGKPPAEGCSQADGQVEALVEYSAQYLFYGPATEQ
jgi:Protein of unknown function (DUF3455)